MKNFWLAVATRLLVLVLVAIGFYWFFWADIRPRPSVVVVNQELGLASKVTGYNKARGYKIYLNSSNVTYNFDRFENQALDQHNGLGHYLEQGDSVYKAPNAQVLRLVRQGQRSSWHLVPPPTTAP